MIAITTTDSAASDAKELTVKPPVWEMYLFVLDDRLGFTAYLVCTGRKRFYKINVWTLTQKDNKWYASPRVTTEITSQSLKHKLAVMADVLKYGTERAYSLPYEENGLVELKNPNLPVDVILTDCVISSGNGNFTRMPAEQLREICLN